MSVSGADCGSAIGEPGPSTGVPLGAADASVAPSALRYREFVWVTVGLSVVIAAQLVLGDAAYLLQRHFSPDEIYFHTLVTDPDLRHSMTALTNGVETNPPALHLVFRAVTSAVGSASETMFRCLSLAFVLVALVGVYATLRKSLAVLPALVAVLGLWCHPLALEQAVDSRFYFPWLAGIVWFAYFLSAAREPNASRWLAIPLALCGVFVCTVHYFGIISWALVIGGEFLLHRTASRPTWPCLFALGLGPLSLMACLPIFFQQRAALTVSSWEEVELGGIWPQLVLLMILAVLAGLFIRWLGRRFGGTAAAIDKNQAFQALIRNSAGLLGLGLLPVIIILISITVQPVLMPRYALPALAALIVILAFGCSLLPRSVQLAACVLLILAGALQLRASAAQAKQFDATVQHYIAMLRQLPDGSPILFEYVGPLNLVCYYAADLAPRCFFLDYERDEIGPTNALRLFGRDLARPYAKYYGVPALLPWASIRNQQRIYFISSLDPLVIPNYPPDYYPGFIIRSRGDGLHELIARASARP
jgi:hypothetical protein